MEDAIFLNLAHFLGAFVIWILLQFVSFCVAETVKERLVRDQYTWGALELGVSTSELDDPETGPKFDKLLWEKYSSEHMRNRFSDSMHWIRMFWVGLGTLLQLLLFFYAVYAVVFIDLDGAKVIWLVVLFSLFFRITSMLISFSTNLISGRYPGEARFARKGLSAVKRKGYWPL